MTKAQLNSLNNKTFFIIKSIKELMDNTIDYEFFKVNQEYFYYFIFRLIYLLNSIGNSDENLVYLYSHSERNLYGRYTDKIGKTTRRPYIFDLVKEILINKNIIYQSGYSQQQHLSRRYGFSKLSIDLLNNTNFDIVKYQLNKTKLKEVKNKNPIDPDALLQYNLLMSNRFKLNEDKAIEFIIQNNDINNIKKKFNLINILNINNKNIFVTKGTHNNRIISSFTNLKSEIRQFCTIDNENLMSIDLQSSQITLFVHYLKLKYKNTIELNKFYELIVEHDIYEYLLQRINELNLNNLKIWNIHNYQYEYISIKNRKDVKKELFRFLYSKINKKNIVSEILKIDYPGIYKLIINEKSERRKKHNINLATELQKLESKIFLPVSNNYINDGALTVHDSIYFKQDLEKNIYKDLTKSLKNNGINKFILVTNH